MGDEIYVGMGEFAISDGTSKLTALGLGSCIGCLLYDTEKKIAGLAHVMLPDSSGYKDREGNKNRFADIVIPVMIQEMRAKGCREEHMIAKIAGGACLFEACGKGHLNVGQKNDDAVRTVLKEKNITLKADDTGGNLGRTVRFNFTTQMLVIKTKEGEHEI